MREAQSISTLTLPSFGRRVMTTRKSGLLAMMFVGISMLAACEDKDDGTGVVVTPPPTITITVAPSSHSMQVGQTITLVPALSGTTDQRVTCTSSNTTVATVDAATCVVTARAAGTAVITVV